MEALSAYLKVVWQHLKVAFRRFVLLFPSEFRYFMSLLLFWPTVAINRLYCALYPARRKLHNRITTAVVLGAAPVLSADIDELHRQGVRGVINLCREWPATERAAKYRSLDIVHLHLPTIDYSIPLWTDIITGMTLIRRLEKLQHSTYVHCKAGRGRSTVVVLCYLVAFGGYTPQHADQIIRRERSHISRKYTEAVVERCLAERDEICKAIDAALLVDAQQD